MNAIFRIAWREYKQYVFSRGFVLFLIMFPLMGALVGAAVVFLETSKPVRYFVVYDEAGGYAEAIDQELETRRQRQILAAFDAYLEIAIDKSKIDPKQLPEPYAPGSVSQARIDAIAAAGGYDAARKAILPFLKPGVMQFAEPRRQFARVDIGAALGNAASVEAVADALRPYLLGERDFPGAEDRGLFAAVLIPKGYTGAEGGAEAQFWSNNLTDPALEFAVGRALSSTARRKLAEKLGLSRAELDALGDVDAPVKSFQPGKAEAGGELNASDRLRSTIIPAALTYMLLVVVFGVGNLLLTNTIEERSNKIVEILLSSVTADQLMMGKLIGIAAVGLTMPTILLIGGGALALVAGAGAAGEMMRDMMGILFTSNFLLVYLFYFLAAYAMFAMIFLAIGAISNSLQDAQSYMGPVLLLVLAPLPFMFMAFLDPNGVVASILTWIPIYTPYAVMMRVAADPPLWEIIGATCLMIVFAIVFGRLMGRIFRAALLQSAPPKAKDLLRLARTRP